MLYNSTQNAKEVVSAAQAIAQGISKDGGLFVPQEFPKYDKNTFKALLKTDYKGRAKKVFSDFLCRRALWCSLSVHRGGGIHCTHHGTLLRQSFCRSHDYVYHRSFDLRRCERLCCILRGLPHCFADVQACQSDTPPDSCGNFGRLLDMFHDSTRLSLHSEHHRHEKLRHNCNGSLPPLPDCYRSRVPDDFRLAGMQSQKIYGAGQAL